MGDLSGTGTISADGGDAGGSNNLGNPGGGGRIALSETSAVAFDRQRITAWPGSAPVQRAMAGSIVIIDPSRKLFLVDDGGRSDGFDSPGSQDAFDAALVPVDAELEVAGEVRLVVTNTLRVKLLHLRDHSIVTHAATSVTAEPRLAIEADEVRIDADAAIDVSDRGYLGDCAPGNACTPGGRWLDNQQGGAVRYAGASHGGPGGGGTNPTYGDPLAPDTL